MLKYLIYFIITIPCWVILFKNKDFKECIIISILVLILEMATKYIL